MLVKRNDANQSLSFDIQILYILAVCKSSQGKIKRGLFRHTDENGQIQLVGCQRANLHQLRSSQVSPGHSSDCVANEQGATEWRGTPTIDKNPLPHQFTHQPAEKLSSQRLSDHPRWIDRGPRTQSDANGLSRDGFVSIVCTLTIMSTPLLFIA